MRKLLILINMYLEDFFFKIYKKIQECYIYKNKIIYDNFYEIKRNKLLIYSMHVDKKISRYTIINKKYFIDNGYDVILVMTLDKRLNISNILKSNDLAGIRIIIRENFGKDFGSFKDVIERVSKELLGVEKLILQNDSLIGPLYASDFLSKVEIAPYDVVGITESLDHEYHLQSSFILIKTEEAISVLKEFMENYIVYQYRGFIVKYGEIAFSQNFINKNVSIGAYTPLIELLENHARGRIFNKKSNAQHLYMDDIFINFNFPYVKRDALKNNPNFYQYDYRNILKLLSNDSKNALMEALIER